MLQVRGTDGAAADQVQVIAQGDQGDASALGAQGRQGASFEGSLPNRLPTGRLARGVSIQISWESMTLLIVVSAIRTNFRTSVPGPGR